MARFSRRVFLAVALLLAPAARLLAVARAARPAPVSLAAFIDLSERLLQRSKLDPEIAQIYLDALNADADSAPTLAYLVEVNNNPTPEMKTLAATIIEWWYTGIYTVGAERHVATHTGALMWSAVGTPADGTCAGAFGAWSRPPREIA